MINENARKKINRAILLIESFRYDDTAGHIVNFEDRFDEKPV